LDQFLSVVLSAFISGNFLNLWGLLPFRNTVKFLSAENVF